MRYSVIQTTWKEILMNPGKSTAKKDTQKSRGFSDEEKAAMRERAKELKAEARADKNKAEGESAALAAIAAMPEPDRAIAKRLHAIIKASAPASRRKPGMGCPPMPTRRARLSASSHLRRSSTRDTR